MIGVKGFLVVNLPNSGQASVNYAKYLGDVGRTSEKYYLSRDGVKFGSRRRLFIAFESGNSHQARLELRRGQRLRVSQSDTSNFATQNADEKRIGGGSRGTRFRGS